MQEIFGEQELHILLVMMFGLSAPENEEFFNLDKYLMILLELWIEENGSTRHKEGVISISILIVGIVD